MDAAEFVTGQAFQGVDTLLLARVVINVAGAKVNVQQSHLSDLRYKVYEHGVQVGAEVVCDVTQTVYNALQTGTVWDVDSVGYNVAVPLPRAYLPTGGKDYRVVLTFTTTGNAVFAVAWKIRCVNPVG